ncbi:MAG: phospholipase D-like domain-containing protein [bacterium]|jgi:cardiolipin synthase
MNSPYQWYQTGNTFYRALLTEIGKAKESVLLETYIFDAGYPGDDIHDALLTALRRGVKVKVLLDAFGSMDLPSDYWSAVIIAGGEVAFFNPLSLSRIALRNHRKLLVCDNKVAFVSGFNISSSETGDGITHGWRDLGLRLNGMVVHDLTSSFERMFRVAQFRHRRLPRLRLRRPRFLNRTQDKPLPVLLASGPGGLDNTIKLILQRDLQHARSIRIISAYFLPTRRIRNILIHAARLGRDVKIITAGKTDVAIARYAGRALYRRLLKAGVTIFEYNAQILHTKLIVADTMVYVGSANLDTRSLSINYELLVRIRDGNLAQEAHEIFQDYLPHCRKIDPATWGQARGWWEKLLERISHFLLARLDFILASRQISKMR